jgi:hypothetical protein
MKVKIENGGFFKIFPMFRNEVVMKDFKALVLLSFLFCFFQCKKDKKSEPVNAILENGKYGFLLQFG